MNVQENAHEKLINDLVEWTITKVWTLNAAQKYKAMDMKIIVS